MTKFLTCILVLYAVILGAACDKTKTLTQLENIAVEMRIHNRNIAKVTNDFHAEGKLSDSFHKGILTAASGFSTALDGADKAIAAAKTVTDGMEGKAALDYAQRLLDTDVFLAFSGIVEAVTNVPAEVKAKIELILASLRAAFVTIRALLADAGAPQIRQEAYANAG
jgi:hypothetical protein